MNNSKCTKRVTLRREYEKKLLAVLRVEVGGTRKEVSDDMQVAESTLRGWIKDEPIHEHAEVMGAAWNLLHIRRLPDDPDTRLTKLEKMRDQYLQSLKKPASRNTARLSTSTPLRAHSETESGYMSSSSEDYSLYPESCTEDDEMHVESAAKRRRQETNPAAAVYVRQPDQSDEYNAVEAMLHLCHSKPRPSPRTGKLSKIHHPRNSMMMK